MSVSFATNKSLPVIDLSAGLDPTSPIYGSYIDKVKFQYDEMKAVMPNWGVQKMTTHIKLDGVEYLIYIDNNV